MVCLGPRRKEKKIADAKKTTKLTNNIKTNAPSIHSTKKTTPRSSLESTKTLPKPLSRNSLLSNERKPPGPVHRSTSPHKPPRPESILSVTSRQLASRNTSTASKRHPISEMKEEVKDLKAKNEENMKLIADQKAELERLKLQLEQSLPSPTLPEEQEQELQEPANSMMGLLKDKEEQLTLRDKEIEALREQLDVLVEEKEAQLEEKKRIMDEKEPQIEQVAKQLELLKLENLDAVNQLASKEKELEELRSILHDQPKEDRQVALEKIEELNKELEVQKKSHREILRLHEQALAEKDLLLQEHQSALDALESKHQQELARLKNAQSNSINELLLKHQQDTLELERQLDEARSELEKNPAVDEQLERLLHEFEQAEHTHSVQIQHLQQSHQSELSDLEKHQKVQLSKLKKTQDVSREKWTSRYLPTEAVSWPSPATVTLRPTTSPIGRIEKSQPTEPAARPSKVQVYYTSISTNPKVKRNQEDIQQLLSSHHVQFSLVDVAFNESVLQFVKKANNNGRSYGPIKDFPQLYVEGHYKGQYEDVVRAIDEGSLDALLSPKKQVRTLKDDEDDDDLLKALEQEMKSGKVVFNLDSF